MQTEYKINQVTASEGLKADAGFDNVLSYRAIENVSFGRGLVQSSDADAARLPRLDLVVLSFDADFVTDNEIDLDINGEAIDTVIFDTDQATTLAALAEEIEANEDVLSAEATDAREITIRAVDGKDVFITNIAVTAGASQAAGSVENSAMDRFVGISLLSHAMEQRRDTNKVLGQTQTSQPAQYTDGEVINTMTRGRVYVKPEQEVTVQDSVYVRFIEDGEEKLRGQFRSDSDNGTAFELAGARYVTNVDTDGFAIVEINLPR